MNKLKSLLYHPNFWPVMFVIFVGVLASRTLIFQDGYFNMHDDLQIMRQLELEKCILDGQLPCRWVPDMGYGFGFPLFNFYPPLPYIVGQFFRFVGFSFVMTAKLTFAVAIIASGVSMYYLAKEFFGRLGGVLSAVFYVWAPYHSVDVYVRGAMNEAWALVWFPLILWTSYKLINAKGKDYVKWIPALALSYSCLLLTHNLMVLVFTPVFGIWLLMSVWQSGKWKRILPLTFSGLWSFGLAFFFTLPAVTENSFTQLKSQLIGYYDYSAHFANTDQLLISRFWGYGPSVWGAIDDGMSFQIGHLHWILSFIIFAILGLRFYRMIKKGKKDLISNIRNDSILLFCVFFFFVGWVYAFMVHTQATPIWVKIPQLSYVQFPWRLLTIVIFAFSFIVGIIPSLFNEHKKGKNVVTKFFLFQWKYITTFALIIFIIVWNWNYFVPENGKMGPLTDDQKLSDAAWDLQQTAGIYDYLPSTAEMAPREPMHTLVEFMEGEGNYSDAELGTNWASARVVVDTEDSTVRLGIFKFPGWKTYVNGEEVENYIAEDEKWGRMYVDLPMGVNNIRAEFTDTTPRTVGNFVSLVSWLALFSFPWWKTRLL